MKNFLRSLWTCDDGVLSFEWVLLSTLLVIGIVSGVAAARDAIIDELGDVSQGIICLDQSFSIDFPLLITIDAYDGSASDSSFTDGSFFDDCPRTDSPTGQTGSINVDGE